MSNRKPQNRRRLAALVPAIALLVAAVLVAVVPVAAASAEETPTLYARLGGFDAIAAVTDDFIGRLASDPKLGRFFVGHSTDSLGRIRQQLVEQLCAATGGPCVYTGRDMKTSHAGLGITEMDWQSTVVHLVATLDKFHVPQAEKDAVLGAISAMKPDIVEKP